MQLHNRDFLRFREIIGFVMLFAIFLVIAFPKNILPQLLQHDNSETSVKYLENLMLYYPKSEEIVELLIEKYIASGRYEQAKRVLVKQKEGYKRYLYDYLLTKKLYFQKRASIEDVKERLVRLAPWMTDYQKQEFLFQEAMSFSLYDIAFQAVQSLNRPKEYIKIAIYLKKYDIAIKRLKEELHKAFDPDYFNQLLEIALFQKVSDEIRDIVFNYFHLVKDKRGYENLLRIGIALKSRVLIEYAIDHVDNLKLKFQGYLALKSYEKAIEIAKREHNTHLVAQLYLWSGDYQRALEYFLKEGLAKNMKIISSLATMLGRYDILERILKERVLQGEYRKIPDLTFVFRSDARYEEGEQFYKALYQKSHKDIFLKELFTLYYDIGDDEAIKEIVWKFKKVPLNIAFYTSELYMSERDFSKAYAIMKKVESNAYEYFNRLYYLANKLGYEQDKMEILQILQKINKTPENVLALYLIYAKRDKVKAFEYLKNNYIKSDLLLYELLKIAYELKEYHFITTFHTTYRPDFYYAFLIKAYTAMKQYAEVKRVYQEAIVKYPALKQDYYWFLISQKDRTIENYLSEINDSYLLFSAYLFLGQRYQAMKVLKALLKESHDIQTWMDYYYLSQDKKVQFLIYRKIDEMVSVNRDILLNPTILDFYFYSALHYKSSLQIQQLLNFIKEHYRDYHKYEVAYLSHIQAYEKIKRIANP